MLAFGDDATDEHMFERIGEFCSDFSLGCGAGVRVGLNKPTCAR